MLELTKTKCKGCGVPLTHTEKDLGDTCVACNVIAAR